MQQNNSLLGTDNLLEVTNRLKNEDQKYARLSKRMQIMYWVLIPVYILITLVHWIEESPIVDILGSLSFLLAMLTFALVFKSYHKEFNTIDYSLPTLQLFKKAAKRYQPFQTKSLWVLLAVLFTDAGLSLNSSLGFQLIKIQIYFVGAIILAIGIGMVIWYIRYKPIRDEALHMVHEMENDA